MNIILILKYTLTLTLLLANTTPDTIAQPKNEFEPDSETQNRPSESECRWQFEQLEVEAAQTIIQNEKAMMPGEGIKIAHIDTGIIPFPALHSDEAGPFGLIFPRDISHVDIFNFVEPHLLPIDNNPKGLNFGHGTETASLLIGRLHWTFGSHKSFQGLVPWAQLIPIKVTDSVIMIGNVATHGTADLKNMAAGIHTAMSLDASVLNVSLGAVFDQGGLIKRAVEEAIGQGAIVVAAAGQTLPINFLPLPANLPGVVSVTASTEKQQPWSDAFSNKNISWAAPGVSVCHLGARLASDTDSPKAPLSRISLATRTGDRIVVDGVMKRSSGTSYSTAFTSGAATLWLQYHGHSALKMRYGPKNISRLFIALTQRFAMETPPHWDVRRHGAGIINIRKLLQAELPCLPSDSQDSCAVKLEQFLKSTSR